MTDSSNPLMELTKSSRKRDKTVMSLVILFVCPDEHVDTDEPDVPVPVSGAESSGDAKVIPPREGVLNRADHHLGVGYEFDAEGHLCRRDSINRLYKVDEFGKRVTSRTTTCPPHIDSQT